MRDLISAAQEHGLTATGLRELGLAQKKQEWVAAAAIFSAYESELALAEYANRFDSPSLLAFATSILQSGAVDELVADFKTILIDDAQELTPSAARFIEALASRGLGLIMFGDPDASTLGFRAADPRIFSDLGAAVAKARGASCLGLALTDILWQRAADVKQLMGRISKKILGTGDLPLAHRKVHFTDLGESMAIESQILKSSESEVAWLARQLREAHLHQGLAWQDIAVVARSRSQLEALELALAAESVPVRIVGAQAALRDEFGARQLLDVLELAYAESYNIDQALVLFNSVFCGLDNLGLRRLRRSLRAAAIEAGSPANSSQLLIEAVVKPDSLADIGSDESRQARRFLQRFEVTRRLAADGVSSIEDLLWQLWDDTPAAKEWPVLARGVGEVAVQANRNLDSVLALFAAANRYVERDPGASAYDFIRAQLDQSVPEDSLALSKRGAKTVDLLTPSGLIGRRYELVAIPQLIEGMFPNLRPRSSMLGANVLSALKFGRIASAQDAVRTEFTDELRMLYKAVGASNNRVLLSAAEVEDSQVSQFIHLALGEIPEAIDYGTAALTLRGMVGKLRRDLAKATDAQAQVQLASALGLLAGEGVPGAHPDSWYGLLPLSTEESLFELEVSAGDGENEIEKVVISPSQLQSWADCPLHWFISTHGGKVQDFSANLGTVIHEALELSETGTEAELMASVLGKWNTLEFESEWQSRAAQRKARKMINIIANYLAGFKGEVATVE
ncbi:MAG: UvrD-helicase domain-containing protein, partial [Micrococcales bacterium]